MQGRMWGGRGSTRRSDGGLRRCVIGDTDMREVVMGATACNHPVAVNAGRKATVLYTRWCRSAQLPWSVITLSIPCLISIDRYSQHTTCFYCRDERTLISPCESDFPYGFLQASMCPRSSNDVDLVQSMHANKRYSTIHDRRSSSESSVKVTTHPIVSSFHPRFPIFVPGFTSTRRAWLRKRR